MANTLLWSMPPQWLPPDKTMLLPFELLIMILDLSSQRTIRYASLVSRHWRSAALAHPQFFRPVTLICGTGFKLADTADFYAVQLVLAQLAKFATPVKLELQVLSDVATHRGEVQKVAVELARAMHAVRYLRICTVSPTLFGVLLQAATATSAPLLRELTLAYHTSTGDSGLHIGWPAALFARDAPRLRVLVLGRGVQPPEPPVQALEQVQSVSVIRGTMLNLGLKCNFESLHRLDLLLRPFSDADVDDLISNTNDLSLPMKLKRLSLSLSPISGSRTVAEIRAISHVLKTVIAAAPTSTMEDVRLPIPPGHLDVFPFNPRPALVGLSTRIEFHAAIERPVGWYGKYQCTVVVASAKTEACAVIREFRAEPTGTNENHYFAPRIMRLLHKDHDLVLLNVDDGILPHLLSTSLVFPTLEQLELRLTADVYKGRLFWPLSYTSICRPDDTEPIGCARVPRLKVMWMRYNDRLAAANVSQDRWQAEYDELSPKPDIWSPGCLVDWVGLELLACELGIGRETGGEKPDLWLTNVFITQDEPEEACWADVFHSVSNKVRP